ncbi:MAG: hypothetical protein WCS92_00355 [Candidatus Babeliales bacterium]|jgi:hypothetical protein
MVNKQCFSIDSMPALLSVGDLVAIGLYSSTNAAYLARVHGNSPDFIKLKRKVLYKRESVADFIHQHTHNGSSPGAGPLVIEQEDKQ